METETILVVEDEPSVLEWVRRVLAKRGYRVLSAANPQEALGIIQRRSESIRLLISDIMLPHMSGQALARRIRDLKPELRVLFISGYTQEAVVQRGGLLEPGAPLLEKPFKAAVLTRTVRTILDR